MLKLSWELWRTAEFDDIYWWDLSQQTTAFMWAIQSLTVTKRKKKKNKLYICGFKQLYIVLTTVKTDVHEL